MDQDPVCAMQVDPARPTTMSVRKAVSRSSTGNPAQFANEAESELCVRYR